MKIYPFLIVSILFGCQPEKKKIIEEKVPINIIETFLNSHSKSVKWDIVSIKDLSSEIKLEDEQIYNGLNCKLYVSSDICGGCFRERILNIRGKYEYTFPIMDTYWYLYLHDIIKNDSTNSDLISLVKKNLCLEKNLNLILAKEPIFNDGKNDYEDASNFVMNTLQLYELFPTIEYIKKDSSLNLYKKPIEFNTSIKENSQATYFDYFKSTLKVDVFQAKDSTHSVKLELLNIDKFFYVSF